MWIEPLDLISNIQLQYTQTLTKALTDLSHTEPPLNVSHYLNLRGKSIHLPFNSCMMQSTRGVAEKIALSDKSERRGHEKRSYSVHSPCRLIL